MTSIIIAGIFVLLISIVSYVLFRIENRQHYKLESKLLAYQHSLVPALNLQVSKYEMLKDRILTLDAVQNKMLVVTRDRDGMTHQLFDLNAVREAHINHLYGNVREDKNSVKRIDSYLQKIVMVLENRNGFPRVEVVFYDQLKNSMKELPVLQQKAREWTTEINSKLKRESMQIA